MPDSLISKLLDLPKLLTKFNMPLFLASCFALLAPNAWLDKLGITIFVTAYKPYIGIAFLLTSAVLVHNSAKWLFGRYMLNKHIAANNAKTLANLTTLDAKEISVLREFFIHGQHTLMLPFANPIVAGLLKKGILVQVGRHGQVSMAGPLASLELSDLVKDLVTLKFVGMHEGQPTEADIRWVQNNRPDFAYELDRWAILQHPYKR
ncbi:MAG: superinfection exclusion B family protein [Nitrospirae bacterium]|nr:superinfection exclusion B family protein [Nitrospirota bacterium]